MCPELFVILQLGPSSSLFHINSLSETFDVEIGDFSAGYRNAERGTLVTKQLLN